MPLGIAGLFLALLFPFLACDDLFSRPRMYPKGQRRSLRGASCMPLDSPPPTDQLAFCVAHLYGIFYFNCFNELDKDLTAV